MGMGYSEYYHNNIRTANVLSFGEFDIYGIYIIMTFSMSVPKHTDKRGAYQLTERGWHTWRAYALLCLSTRDNRACPPCPWIVNANTRVMYRCILLGLGTTLWVSNTVRPLLCCGYCLAYLGKFIPIDGVDLFALS